MKVRFFLKYLLLLNVMMITSCKAQKITYQPIGIMDKPLPEIFIGNKCEEGELNCFVLDEYDLQVLAEFITENYPIVKMDSTNSTYPYGAYKIIIEAGNKDEYIILNNKKESQDFFENQLPYLQKNEKLVSKILALTIRLK